MEPNVHRWDKLAGSNDTPTVVESNNLLVSVDNSDSTSLLQHRMTILSGSDFGVQVDWDITPSANNGIAGWGVFLEARYPSDNNNRLRIYQSGADTTYITQAYKAGVLDNYVAVANNTPTGKFRIIRTGENWRAYYWNGVTFSQMSTGSNIGKDDVELRIYLQNWTNKPAVSAYFDNFIVSAGYYECPQSSTSSSSSSSSSESSSSSSRSSSSSSSSSTSSSSSSSSSSISTSISSSSSSSSSSLSSSSSSSSLSSSSSSSSSSLSSSSSSSSSSTSSSSSSSESVSGYPITEFQGWKEEPDTTPLSGALLVEEPLLVDLNRYIDFATYWRDTYSYGISLGSVQQITKMKVYGNTNDTLVPSGWTASASTFEVYYSTDNMNWTLLKTVVSPFLHQYAAGQWGFSITLSASPISASWIKIRYNDVNHVATLSPATSGIRIGEIELYGVNSSSSSSSSSSLSSSSSSSSSSVSSSSSSSSVSSSSQSSSSSSSSNSSSSSSFSDASYNTLIAFTNPDVTTSTINNVPAAMHLSPSAGRDGDDVTDIFNEIGDNWKKLRVYDANGNRLFVEVKQWDADNQDAWIWFRVPEFNSGIDRQVTLQYGRNFNEDTHYIGKAGSYASNKVWSDYVAVYHMNQHPSGGTLKDSSPEGNDGTMFGTIQQVLNSYGGRVLDFSASGGTYIDCGNSASLNTSGDYTVEIAFYKRQLPLSDGNEPVVSRFNNDSGNPGWWYGLYNTFGSTNTGRAVHKAADGTNNVATDSNVADYPLYVMFAHFEVGNR